MRGYCGLSALFMFSLAIGAQPVCTFVGDAGALGNDCYQITDNNEWELGAVWFNEPLDLSQSVTIDVEVNLGSADAMGADGIVFVMQNFGPAAIGMAGGGLGFEGFNPSFGIEIDTWQNVDLGDPVGDHVAFLRDGVNNHNAPYFNLAGPVSARSDGANIEDGQPHRFRLEWDEPAQSLTFLFDCEVRLTLDLDLVNDLFDGDSDVWWGFTGSTGGSSNTQVACITAAAVGLPPTFEMCDGESVELALEATAEGTVSWDPQEGLSDPDNANTLASPDATTTYTATWTDICGEVLTAVTTVEVSPLPEPDLPPEVSLCPGETASLSVSVPAGGTALWSDGTEGPDWTGDDPGVQSVEVTGATGCAGTASTTVVVLEPLEVDLPEISALCAGEVYPLDWPAGTNDWTVNGAVASDPWQATAGDFVIEAVDAGTGCALEWEVSVPALNPDAPYLTPDAVTCAGQGIPLGLDAGAGAVFEWSPVQGLDDPALEQPLASPSATTEYTATVTDVCGTVIELTSTVTVFEVPDPGLPDSVSFCPGETSSLSVEPLPGVADPIWSDGSSGWQWSGNVGGWVSVEVSPLPECTGTDSTFVEAFTPAVPSFEVDPLCPGEFTFVPWPTGWVDWQVDGASADPDGLTVTSPGVFFLVAEELASGCGVASSVVVPTGALQPMALPDLVELCEDAAVTLDAGVSGSVFWSDGVTGAVRSIDSPGFYIATQTTDCGTVLDSVEVVEVPCGCAVFAPSAFTPDGDFVNDAWRPSFECNPEEYTLIIFDRWGSEIWASNNPLEYWTGGVRRDGRPLDEKRYYVRDGIYAFQVTYRDPTSVVRKMIRKTGSIQILR